GDAHSIRNTAASSLCPRQLSGDHHQPEQYGVHGFVSRPGQQARYWSGGGGIVRARIIRPWRQPRGRDPVSHRPLHLSIHSRVVLSHPSHRSGVIMATINRLESEVRGYVRSSPVEFASASGSRITAADGTVYLDFFGGAGALNYGHNEATMKAALIDYLQADGIA